MGKLLTLHRTADECGDPQMTDFIEGNFLEEQVQAIKDVSNMVAQLRRVGKGHGVYHFDAVAECCVSCARTSAKKRARHAYTAHECGCLAFVFVHIYPYIPGPYTYIRGERDGEKESVCV